MFGKGIQIQTQKHKHRFWLKLRDEAYSTIVDRLIAVGNKLGDELKKRKANFSNSCISKPVGMKTLKTAALFSEKFGFDEKEIFIASKTFRVLTL